MLRKVWNKTLDIFGNLYGTTYALPSICIFLWWLFLRPGFYSTDSISQLDRLNRKVFSSEWTAIWDFMVFVLSVSGKHPEMATLFFSLLFVNSVTFLLLRVYSKNIAQIVSLVVCNLPPVAHFSLTLWHDVPMTSGLFLLSGLLMRPFTPSFGSLTALGIALALANTRHNGPWTVLVTAVVLFLFRKISFRFSAILVVVTLVVSIPLGILNSRLTTWDNVQVSGITHWMKYDISCYLARNPINSQVSTSNLYMNLPTSERSCVWFMESENLERWRKFSQQEIGKYWLNFFWRSPVEIYRIHEDRASYLVPKIWQLPSKPPFLHTNIEYENLWVQPWNEEVYELFRIPARLWNFAGPLTAYAGLWWFLILVAWLRNGSFFPILVLASSLNFTVFVTAIIADARYVIYSLIIGQAHLIALVVQNCLTFRYRGSKISLT